MFAVPRRSHSEQAIKDVRDISRPVQEELEKFFIATDELEDKKLKILGWKGTQGGGAGHQGRREIFRERRVEQTRRLEIRQPLPAVF